MSDQKPELIADYARYPEGYGYCHECGAWPQGKCRHLSKASVVFEDAPCPSRRVLSCGATR